MLDERCLKDYVVTLKPIGDTPFEATVSAVSEYAAGDMIARQLKVRGADIYFDGTTKQFMASTDRYCEAFPLIVTEVVASTN